MECVLYPMIHGVGILSYKVLADILIFCSGKCFINDSIVWVHGLFVFVSDFQCGVLRMAHG